MKQEMLLILVVTAHYALPASVNNQDPASSTEAQEDHDTSVGIHSEIIQDQDPLFNQTDSDDITIEQLMQGKCRPGFSNVPSSNSCYRLVTEPRKWSDAQGLCNAMAPEVHLAKFDDERQYINFMNTLNVYAIPELQKCDSASGPKAFIGAQRYYNGVCSSAFVWKPYASDWYPMTYSNWDHGEPNCVYDHRYGSGESCAAFWTRNNYLWNDWSCDNLECYVCQYILEN